MDVWKNMLFFPVEDVVAATTTVITSKEEEENWNGYMKWCRKLDIYVWMFIFVAKRRWKRKFIKIIK